MKLKDSKFLYWFAGAVASLSILIERKSRRSELALYAFPRGADSLYMILYDHQLVFKVPQGEQLLFAISMAVIMFFYENDRKSLSPLVTKLMERFLPEGLPMQLLNNLTEGHRQCSIYYKLNELGDKEEEDLPRHLSDKNSVSNESAVTLSGGMNTPF